MLKLTDKIKQENKESLKGKVYIFILAANDLALANNYKYLKTDTGIKQAETWINLKLDEITKPHTGQFWDEKYVGWEKILEAGRLAKQDIQDGNYTPIVAEFLDTVLMSHVPKASLKGQSSQVKPQTLKNVLEVERGEKIPTFIDERVTGAKLKKEVALEEEFDESLDELEGLDDLLDEEIEEELEEDDNTDLTDLL